MAVKKEQYHWVGIEIESQGYLAIAVIASLILSFIVLGGAVLPAEAAKKGSPSNSQASDNSTSAASKNKESKENKGQAAATQEQQGQQSGSTNQAEATTTTTTTTTTAGANSSSLQSSTAESSIDSKILVANDKDIVTAGDTQTVYAAVIGAGHKPVSNATVFATVFFGKNVEKKFTASTQSDGTVVFTWQIEKHNKTGLVGMDIKAEASGYDTGYGNLVFLYKN